MKVLLYKWETKNQNDQVTFPRVPWSASGDRQAGPGHSPSSKMRETQLTRRKRPRAFFLLDLSFSSWNGEHVLSSPSLAAGKKGMR
jgi:hypothetical protein